jgi:hypothetical protein
MLAETTEKISIEDITTGTGVFRHTRSKWTNPATYQIPIAWFTAAPNRKDPGSKNWRPPRKRQDVVKQSSYPSVPVDGERIGVMV